MRESILKKEKKLLNTAIILAAGFGARLHPITFKLPKPLVKVGKTPLIDHVLSRLKCGGVQKVVVNLHYLGEQIEQHLSSWRGMEIVFSWEKEGPLETGGGVKAALSKLGNNAFWVINSDSIWLNGPTDMMARMVSMWDETKMDALLLMHSTVDAYGYEGTGDFNITPDGRIIRKNEHEVVPWVFTGIQILHPRFLESSPVGKFSLNLLYEKAIKNGRLYGLVHDGEWFHVGSLEALNQIERYMEVPYAGIKRR